MCKNFNLDLVNINAYAKFGQFDRFHSQNIEWKHNSFFRYWALKFHQFILKRLSRNKILTQVKGHKSVINLDNLTHNNPNIDLVNIKVYAKFC